MIQTALTQSQCLQHNITVTSTLPQSLIVAFSGPHLRQQDRNTDTRGGKETDSKERQGGMTRKRKKGEGQREADKTKKLKTRQKGAATLSDRVRPTQGMFVDMLAHGRTHCSFTRGKLDPRKFHSAPDSQPCHRESMSRQVSMGLPSLKIVR